MKADATRDAAGLVPALAAMLRGNRYRFAGEKGLQEAISSRLADSGLAFRREHDLGGGDVVDFLVAADGPGVALEVKVDGPLASVTRQLHRYAAHADVGAVVLATTLRRHDAMPAEMAGKPVRVVVLPGALS